MIDFWGKEFLQNIYEDQKNKCYGFHRWLSLDFEVKSSKTSSSNFLILCTILLIFGSN